jgi:hypothetical protein
VKKRPEPRVPESLKPVLNRFPGTGSECLTMRLKYARMKLFGTAGVPEKDRPERFSLFESNLRIN